MESRGIELRIRPIRRHPPASAQSVYLLIRLTRRPVVTGGVQALPLGTPIAETIRTLRAVLTTRPCLSTSATSIRSPCAASTHTTPTRGPDRPTAQPTSELISSVDRAGIALPRVLLSGKGRILALADTLPAHRKDENRDGGDAGQSVGYRHLIYGVATVGRPDDR